MSAAPWEELERPGPATVVVAGVEVGRGSRVRLAPRPGGDVMDGVLAGRVAVVESVEHALDGEVQLAVTVEDDPGRDLGELRQPGHRFFFFPREVEPLGEAPAPVEGPRVLVAGIGNVFLGDDGFGVEVAQRLLARRLPAGVHVEDYGIRGMDLAYALADYDVAVLVDALPRGQRPGALTVLEVDPEDAGAPPGPPDAHGMDPVQVLGLARALGGLPGRVLVVGCEPAVRMRGDEEDVVAALSEPVRAALEPAARLVEDLARELTAVQGPTEERS